MVGLDSPSAHLTAISGSLLHFADASLLPASNNCMHFLCPILFQEECKAIYRKTWNKIKTNKSKRKFKYVSNRGKIKQATGTNDSWNEAKLMHSIIIYTPAMSKPEQ